MLTAEPLESVDITLPDAVDLRVCWAPAVVAGLVATRRWAELESAIDAGHQAARRNGAEGAAISYGLAARFAADATIGGAVMWLGARLFSQREARS